jgi:flagellar hook-associated protein 2
MVSGTGGSIEVLLNSYRTLESQPIRNLEDRRSNFDNRISLFNKLKTQLKDLESITKELGYGGTTSIFGKKASTSSDETVATVTASSTAVATSTSLFVSQLAKADKVISNQYANAGTELEGAVGAGTHTFDITVNGVTAAISVAVEAGDSNETILQKVADAVNNTAEAGVRASIIKDTATSERLIFTSEETGADFEMNLSDTSGSLLSSLGLNDSTASSGTSGGYLYDSDALNAIAIIDGIEVQSNTNTLENVLSGLTIDLKKAQTVGDTPITINVENDVEGIKEKLQKFVDVYNSVIDYIKSNTAVNTATYERSAFSGDYSVNNFRFQMRQIIAAPVTGLPLGEPTIMSAFGFDVDRTGKLSIKDSKKLDDAIKNNIGQLDQIFSSTDGYASRMQTLLDTMINGEGIIEKRKSVLQGQIGILNNRIKQMESSVDRKIEYYRTQFAQLQAAYAQFQAQSSYVSALSQSSFVSY